MLHHSSTHLPVQYQYRVPTSHFYLHHFHSAVVVKRGSRTELSPAFRGQNGRKLGFARAPACADHHRAAASATLVGRGGTI